MKVVAGAFQKAADTLKEHFDKKEPIILTEETARKIFTAGIKWAQFARNGGTEYPDFETFYNQLIGTDGK